MIVPDNWQIPGQARVIGLYDVWFVVSPKRVIQEETYEM